MESFVKFPFSFLNYGPKIVQKSAFFAMCLPQQETKSVKAIYIYASESCYYTLSLVGI